jgi:anti-anti-sigma factor
MATSSIYESSPLVIEVRARTSAVTVIAVAGEIDISNCAELRRELAELISRNSADRVALDLRKLTFLGSAGIGVLLHGRELVRRQGGRLEITHAHENVRQVLDLSGLTDLFQLSVPRPPEDLP